MIERLTPAENPILAREEALTSILLGNSDLAAADDGERAMHDAHTDLMTRGSGIGFGFIRNLGFDGDKVRLLYAITDGTRDACFQVLISGSQLPRLKDIDEIDEWVYERLPRLDCTGSARYAQILLAHPVALW
jgi:hypothetical protein